jgi:hypothetical protein
MVSEAALFSIRLPLFIEIIPYFPDPYHTILSRMNFLHLETRAPESMNERNQSKKYLRAPS